jgi:PASTA domain
MNIISKRLGALALAALALASMACSPKDETAAADPPTTAPEVRPEVMTTEAPASVAPSTDAPVVTAAPTPTALMPNVVCMNLQDAQDLIQEQGVFLSLSQDATGEGRMQILDANWQVVSQFPAAGTPIDEGDAMLDVVKYGESSPCS